MFVLQILILFVLWIWIVNNAFICTLNFCICTLNFLVPTIKRGCLFSNEMYNNDIKKKVKKASVDINEEDDYFTYL